MTAGDIGIMGAMIGVVMALVKVIEKSVTALVAKRNGNGANGNGTHHRLDLLHKDLQHWHEQQTEISRQTLELIKRNTDVMDKIDRRIESRRCPHAPIRAVGDNND